MVLENEVEKEIKEFTDDENFNELMRLYIKTHKSQHSDEGVLIEEYVDGASMSPVILYRTYRSQESLKKFTILLTFLTAILVVLTAVLIYYTIQI